MKDESKFSVVKRHVNENWSNNTENLLEVSILDLEVTLTVTGYVFEFDDSFYKWVDRVDILDIVQYSILTNLLSCYSIF